ncbi:hypothetical protein VTK26DRAFT_2992 [Humicola hyalothermophila]
MATNRTPIVITYHKRDVVPPLYVAGTFSDPPWQAQEMDDTTGEDGEHYFQKEVYAAPGSKIQYKFRIGNGDWWVLDDHTPTMTDGAGNVNHVLEVKPPKKEAEPSQPKQAQEATGGDAAPLTDGKAAAKRVQAPAEATPSRSGTGTPIFAKVAAEVADSAKLLHEDVPEREGPGTGKQSHDASGRRSSQMSEAAETAAEVADTAAALDRDDNALFVLEPPPGEGRPYVVRAQDEKHTPLGDQDQDIAHKSPLFSHECAGMSGAGEEVFPPDVNEDEIEEEEDYDPGSIAPGSTARVQDIDFDKVDLNDPTLERFPASRDDIMDAVRKLGTGLPVDDSTFAAHPRVSVFNPSRRGTEDITGDYTLTSPQPPSPNMQRVSKKSPGGSISSLPAAASLHSISEAEELAGEEEETDDGKAKFPPAIIFSNPDMRPRPKHLELPGPQEDEAVALQEGVSPRTTKPTHRRIVTPDVSPSASPPSLSTGAEAFKNLAPPDAELTRDKERSTQEVVIHAAPEETK